MKLTLKTLIICLNFALISSAHAGPQAATPSPSPSATPNGSDILGFKDWKAQRVEEARFALDKAAVDISGEKEHSAITKASTSGQPAAKTLALAKTQQTKKGESRVQQAQLSYEIATELSVNDYFVVYLSQLKSDQAFVEAVTKMSPQEIAELMTAYKKHLEGGRTASVGMLPGLMKLNVPAQSAGSQNGPNGF